MKNYDACVIGSGPAALAVSICLLQAGARVFLIRKSSTQNKFHYGETLSRKAVPYLVRLGAYDAFIKSGAPIIDTLVSSWGSHLPEVKSRMQLPDGFGWLLNRRDLESVLLHRAIVAGCQTTTRETYQATRRGQRWEITMSENADESVGADFLIVATGRESHELCRQSRKVKLDNLVAHIATVPDEKPERDPSIYLDSDPSGWFFSVAGASGQRIIVYFSDGDLSRNISRDKFPMFLQGRISSLPSISKFMTTSFACTANYFQVTVANTAYRKFRYDRNLIFCGDAAQTFDPLSSQGITHAVSDGIGVADMVVRLYNGETNACREHEMVRRSTFVDYLKSRNALYRTERRWSGNLFWRRRQGLSELTLFKEKLK